VAYICVLRGKAPNGVPLVALGYHFNAKAMPCFVMMEDAGMMNLGDPYEMKYTDMHGNVHVRMVDCPDVISKCFQGEHLFACSLVLFACYSSNNANMLISLSFTVCTILLARFNLHG